MTPCSCITILCLWTAKRCRLHLKRKTCLTLCIESTLWRPETSSLNFSGKTLVGLCRSLRMAVLWFERASLSLSEFSFPLSLNECKSDLHCNWNKWELQSYEINESCAGYFGTLLSCIIVCAKSEVSRMVLIDGKKNVFVLGLTQVNPFPHNDSHLNLRLAKTLANGSLYCIQASDTISCFSLPFSAILIGYLMQQVYWYHQWSFQAPSMRDSSRMGQED